MGRNLMHANKSNTTERGDWVQKSIQNRLALSQVNCICKTYINLVISDNFCSD